MDGRLEKGVEGGTEREADLDLESLEKLLPLLPRKFHHPGLDDPGYCPRVLFAPNLSDARFILYAESAIRDQLSAFRKVPCAPASDVKTMR